MFLRQWRIDQQLLMTFGKPLNPMHAVVSVFLLTGNAAINTALRLSVALRVLLVLLALMRCLARLVKIGR
jgi:hypothetical protein